MSSPMTMDERVEAAARELWERSWLPGAPSWRWEDLFEKAQIAWREDAKAALAAAFPELHGDQPKGWIAPWEATEAMATKGAAFYDDNWRPGHAREDTAMPYIWDAMRDAYLGKGDGG